MARDPPPQFNHCNCTAINQPMDEFMNLSAKYLTSRTWIEKYTTTGHRGQNDAHRQMLDEKKQTSADVKHY